MPNYVICEISKDPKPCVNAVVISNNITYITLWDFVQKSFVIRVFLICFVQLICKIESYPIINNRESEKKQKPIDYYVQLFYFLYLSFDLLIFETILKNLFLHLIFLQELKFINKSVKYYNLQKINDRRYQLQRIWTYFNQKYLVFDMVGTFFFVVNWLKVSIKCT